MKIYFAGPLFTPYERDYISRTAQALRERGFDPFVPHENVQPDRTVDRFTRARQIFDKDFGAIEEANAILAILNGTEVDDGTACEIGIFYALKQDDPTKIGVVGLHEDWRTSETGEGKGMNAFVLGCIRRMGTVVSSLEEAIVQLEKWRDELTERVP